MRLLCPKIWEWDKYFLWMHMDAQMSHLVAYPLCLLLVMCPVFSYGNYQVMLCWLHKHIMTLQSRQNLTWAYMQQESWCWLIRHSPSSCLGTLICFDLLFGEIIWLETTKKIRHSTNALVAACNTLYLTPGLSGQITVLGGNREKRETRSCLLGHCLIAICKNRSSKI